tara:strand:+ start:1947 stop:2096 length:150 start_codon:yes stop_codon:yes gene_type:complete
MQAQTNFLENILNTIITGMGLWLFLLLLFMVYLFININHPNNHARRKND